MTSWRQKMTISKLDDEAYKFFLSKKGNLFFFSESAFSGYRFERYLSVGCVVLNVWTAQEFDALAAVGYKHPFFSFVHLSDVKSGRAYVEMIIGGYEIVTMKLPIKACQFVE
jgi:hypothetical protein